MMRPGSSLVAHPGFGVLVVAIGTLVVPFDSSVNFASPTSPAHSDCRYRRSSGS